MRHDHKFDFWIGKDDTADKRLPPFLAWRYDRMKCPSFRNQESNVLPSLARIPCQLRLAHIAVCVAGLLASSLSCGSLFADTGKPPNLLLILVDDLGFGDVGFQAAPDIETPNLDRLASEGITFTQMRANCTVCSPTRAAILTGRYPDRVGVPGVIRTHPENSWGYLTPSVATLATRLAAVEYRTAAIGKWHLGLQSPNIPNERGFQFFHGFLGDMMDDYYTHRRGGLNFMRLNKKVIEPKGHATELFTEWAIDYLGKQSRTRAGENQDPFFLYLAYNAPHFPIQPPEDWLNKTRGKFPSGDDKRIQNIAFVEHLDHSIGRLTSAIDMLGLRENTVVAFTSDNGGSLPHGQRNLPFRDGKQSHYDGGLRVPFVVRTPQPMGTPAGSPVGSTTTAGTQSNYAGLTFDLHATFLDLAGCPRDRGSDAVSLRPILSGKKMPDETREMYFVRREGGNRYVGKAYHAIIRGRWKLLQNDAFSPLELYDLVADPGEKNNVIENQTKIANDLKRALRAHIQRGGRVSWQP